MIGEELTAKDIKRLMLGCYSRYKRGLITEAQAYRENVMLANILKAFEASDNEERLLAIQNLLSK